jgi:hypothetical protein
MLRTIVAAGAAILVCGCSEEKPVQEAETAASLAAGQYEASWKVTGLRSIDKTTPATNLKQDATGTTTACVAADGTIDPKLFAEDGDKCTVSNPYIRNGRMNLSLTCKRGSDPGQLNQTVSGTFKADSLDAEVSTTTYLAGRGDYELRRTFTAKRVGECQPAAPEGNAS